MLNTGKNEFVQIDNKKYNNESSRQDVVLSNCCSKFVKSLLACKWVRKGGV